MRQFRVSKMLGLAITEQGLLLTELAAGDPRSQVRRLATFPYPGGALPASVGALGRPLAQFLRQEGFTTHHVVIGVPARWIIVKSKDLPPVDPAAAADILRLETEGAFTAELKDLVYDFTGTPDRARASRVLLLAAARERLAQIDEMAQGARLTVEAVLPSVAALAAVSRPLVAPGGFVFYLSAQAAELASQNGAGLQRLQHLAGAVPAGPGAAYGVSAEIVTELRRSLLSLPAHDHPDTARKFVLWNAAGLDAAARLALGEQLGLDIQTPDLAALSLDSSAPQAEANGYAPAAALAALGLAEAPFPVDFAHSRLAPRPPGLAQRKRVWIGAGAAVLLAILAFLIYTLVQASEVSGLQAKSASQKGDVTAAKALQSRVNFAREWYGTDSRYLACFRQLTAAFPEDGSAWVTDLDLQSSLKGQLSGKAISQPVALSIMDRLKSSGKFDIKTSDVHDGGRSSRETTFSLTFVYREATAREATTRAAPPRGATTRAATTRAGGKP